ncbi:hypothetical protein ACQ4PT_018040 [Festuca glaucescens]
MEPENSGTGQTSPRGNDWEVVQLTASNYASAPGPARSEPSDEESAGHVYGTKGDDSAAAALMMSGHFSVPQNEAQNLLVKADSTEREEARGSQYAVSDTGDDRDEEKLKDDDVDRIPSFDKGKSHSLVDMEPDDGNTSHGVSLSAEDTVMFSSSGHVPTVVAEKELSWSATESKTTEEKTEDPTLQNVDTVTGSSKVVASGEESRPDGSGGPRGAWWQKQIISLYKSARESNKFWPIIVAGAALMGMAYFRRRWLKGKLHLQQVKLQPASSKERINHTVAPLNRIKDILATGNHPSPAPHGHARLS